MAMHLALWSLWSSSGCGDTSPPAAPTMHDATATREAPATQPADDEVALRVAGVEELEQLLAEYRGQVVLVDFWATWCLPCVEQFPHTVALYREHQARGLAVISVSMNELDEQPEVLAFLKRQNATFPNLLSKYGGGTEAVDAFGLPGSVPYYRVYDRSGELRHEFGVDPLAEKQFTAEDIDKAIEELL